jgi:hypothetical protein
MIRRNQSVFSHSLAAECRLAYAISAILDALAILTLDTRVPDFNIVDRFWVRSQRSVIMASDDPFNFQSSRTIAPILCMNCGRNAHCVRRQAKGILEIQTFFCTCGHTVERAMGPQVSDATIQKVAEALVRGTKT